MSTVEGLVEEQRLIFQQLDYNLARIQSIIHYQKAVLSRLDRNKQKCINAVNTAYSYREHVKKFGNSSLNTTSKDYERVQLWKNKMVAKIKKETQKIEKL